MYFKPAQYMEYAKALDLTGIECNLAFSGITCPFTLAELGVTARVLEKAEYRGYGNTGFKEYVAGLHGVATDQVLAPGGGSSLCNFLLAAAILNPGDRVLIEMPTYEPLYSTIASTGAEMVQLPRPFHRDFELDPNELELMMTRPVKLVVLTRPHNPSGRDVSVERLKKMGEIAADIGAYVLVDEVYLDFLPEEDRIPAAKIHPRLISTNSLTKVYGQGDLRTGWAVGPADLIWKCWKINNVLGVNPPVIPDLVAVELIRSGGLERIGAWSRRRARENLAIIEDFMVNQEDLTWVKPDTGIIAYLQLKPARPADVFVRLLSVKYKTAVMPGNQFSLPYGFRLGFGVDPAMLREGLRRIELAFRE
ncbi:MAG: aminotransferase class I/II-fold pyridoxal phosphate-dependent enzyme [bacterium]|nr:aminotransferase class I/II-fold pyridoxal phosphate-dependent enzyme [bacterium]